MIKEKGNLLGDGANIAARLEALAQTDGITVSKVVYDYVKGKTDYAFNDLGVQKVTQNEFHASTGLAEEGWDQTNANLSRQSLGMWRD